MKAFVTGCAGFLGSHLVDRLLADGHSVVGFDNLSTGHYQPDHPHFDFYEGDIENHTTLVEAMRGCDVVFHLAALADVRDSKARRLSHLRDNAVGTYNVLDVAVFYDVKRFVFMSSASVYGEPTVFPTPEIAPMPIQTSFYGASKLAGEAFCQAYSAAFGMQVYIFRLVSLLGERYTHGHVADFVNQLQEHPDHLDVLGNGQQAKSYLYVGDAVEGILTGLGKGPAAVNIFNVGTDETTTVRENIAAITRQLGHASTVEYEEERRGWIGDSPKILLDCTRLCSLGWEPKLTIAQALERTVEYLTGDWS